MEKYSKKSIWIASTSVAIVALMLILSLSPRIQKPTESEISPGTPTSTESSAVTDYSKQPVALDSIPPPQPEQTVETTTSIPLKPTPEDTEVAPSQPAEPATPISEPSLNKPQTTGGLIYVPGFGWIPDEGGGGKGIDTCSDGDPDKQIGEM